MIKNKIKNKILVVDDEPEFLEMVKMRLEANNYEVIAATNGKEGLKKVRLYKPDLVILDILMPEMEGTTMAQILRENPDTQDIPIIFLTCLLMKGEEKQWRHIIGKAPIMAKPIDPDELLLKIEECLRK